MFRIIRTVHRLNRRILAKANEQKAEWNTLSRGWKFRMGFAGAVGVLLLLGTYREHHMWKVQSAYRKEQMRLARERIERKRLDSHGFVPDDDAEREGGN